MCDVLCQRQRNNCSETKDPPSVCCATSPAAWRLSLWGIDSLRSQAPTSPVSKRAWATHRVQASAPLSKRRQLVKLVLQRFWQFWCTQTVIITALDTVHGVESRSYDVSMSWPSLWGRDTQHCPSSRLRPTGHLPCGASTKQLVK